MPASRTRSLAWLAAIVAALPTLACQDAVAPAKLGAWESPTTAAARRAVDESVPGSIGAPRLTP